MDNCSGRKSLDELIEGTREEGHQLKKVLGPWNLIALGIGAIIGAGIFATIGTAAAGDAQRPGAGPALMISFVLTAVVCGFSALCYAEFASMVPVAGSAYTYSYATLGELVAWIIGWDLMIEYAIGNVAVAISWANYMNTLLEGFGINLPGWLTVDYGTALSKMPQVVASAPHIFGIPIIFNILAVFIVTVITIVLVWGIRESASFNFWMVAIKLVVLGFFVLRQLQVREAGELAPVRAKRMGRHQDRRGDRLLRVHRLRRGLDDRGGGEESETRSADRHHRLADHLHGDLRGHRRGIYRPDSVRRAREDAVERAGRAADPGDEVRLDAGLGWSASWRSARSSRTRPCCSSSSSASRASSSRCRATDLLPQFFARVHPKFRTPHVATIITGDRRRRSPRSSRRSTRW